MGSGFLPHIDVVVQAGDWPEERRLQRLAARSVSAAAAVLPPSSASRPGIRPDASATPELSIVFTDDAAIRRLNAEWRGKDKPTNVLSFPQAHGPLLGDIVLGFETVRDEAALAGKALEAHMGHLIVHGFLHLVGYDHEAEGDAEAMEALERAALERMGIADPYAAALEE